MLQNYNVQQERVNRKINILEYWRNMKTVQPELYKLSVVVFAVPATQVSVERLFSGLKFILSPLRSTINGSVLEDQLLIRVNRIFEQKEKVLTKV